MILKGKKTAVVLSGGGAKGAFHTGMFRALEEESLEKERLTLAGTSIGALNSLMYAISDTDDMREMIYTLGNTSESAAEFARRFYPDEKLLGSSIPVSVCAYCIEHERVEYFRLTGLPAQEQRDLVIASASLPDKLPPMEYKGLHYLDGGKIPPQCSENAGPQDKIPIRILKQEWEKQKEEGRNDFYERIIIGYLKPDDSVDISWIPKTCEVLEIRPSEPLEDAPDTGTRDYSEERLQKNEKLGYENTKDILAKYRTHRIQ